MQSYTNVKWRQKMVYKVFFLGHGVCGIASWISSHNKLHMIMIAFKVQQLALNPLQSTGWNHKLSETRQSRDQRQDSLMVKTAIHMGCGRRKQSKTIRSILIFATEAICAMKKEARKKYPKCNSHVCAASTSLMHINPPKIFSHSENMYNGHILSTLQEFQSSHKLNNTQ